MPPVEPNVGRVRLFGEIEVFGRFGSTGFAGNKQRSVLARLALDAGRVVSIEELIDAVWGEASPESVRSAVQVHISQLRRAMRTIGLEPAIVTRPPGYVLDLATEAVDVLRFESLVTDATRSGSHGDEVLRISSAAEALWLGAPLSAVGDAPFAVAVRARLSGRRVDLATACAAAAIEEGRPLEVLTHIETLAADHPFSEPLWVALASLLHAAGRPPEALSRLATLRRTLADELGFVAGAAVDDAERRILLHESPALGGLRGGARADRSVPHLRPPVAPSLLGRSELIRSLVDLIALPGLVTLIGPAGVGKTSVAAHLAGVDPMRHTFAPAFVDLAAVGKGQPIGPTVAAAIGLRPSGPDLLEEELLGALKDRHQLLVLDNCEHVLDQATSLASLVVEAANLTLLATSRTPLGCRHERVVHVPLLDRDSLTELFFERARMASSTFDPDCDEHVAIQSLIDRLDGLPLGVELVAPLVRSMSVEEIVRQADLFGVPAGPTRAVARHNSLADAVGWSIGLLPPGERRLLSRLGVFASGALASSVQAVCGDQPDRATIGDHDVLGLLRSLVEASLVIPERTPDGTWYRMLFPIREEAARLLHAQESEFVRMSQRHAEHVVDLVRSACMAIVGSTPTEGLRQLERAAPEVRRAYAWYEQTGNVDSRADLLVAFAPHALAATAALPELQGWLRRMLDEAGGPDPALWDAHHRFGDELWMRLCVNAAKVLDLDVDRHSAVLRSGLRIAVERGDVPNQILANAMLCDVVAEADIVAAAVHGLATVAQARRHGDPVLEAYALQFALNMLFRARRLDDAADLLADARSTNTSKFGVLEPSVLFQLGRLELAEHDLPAAQATFGRCERAARSVGSATGVSWALFGAAEVARRQGRLDDALELFRASCDLDRLVAPREEWMGLDRIARVGLLLGDEHAIADAVGRLRDRTGLVAAAVESARGCLAACRGNDSIAVAHLRRAFEMCVSMSAVEYFAELIDTYAYVRGLGDALATVRDDIRSGDISLGQALDRLQI